MTHFPTLTLEEILETTTAPSKPGEKSVTKTAYRPLKNSGLNHETQVSETLVKDKVFPDVVHFEHTATYNELKNQFLSIYLLDTDSPQAGPQN